MDCPLNLQTQSVGTDLENRLPESRSSLVALPYALSPQTLPPSSNIHDTQREQIDAYSNS
jgi:hypothetical protein